MPHRTPKREGFEATTCLDALIKKYKKEWSQTMPQKGKEKGQTFLHGYHYGVGEFLRDLTKAKTEEQLCQQPIKKKK